jgi:1-acyl-sn-glycerol-3-phosphate acyltransferase
VSEGEENIPASGPAIVIAPHLGSIDAVLAPELVTRAGRMPRIMAKKSLWKIPVVKQAFNSGNLIPVARSSDDGSGSNANEVLAEAVKAIEQGDLVFIFPEGTYSKDPDSWPMTCKSGAARLALMTGVPVIPIMQDGEQFMVKGNEHRPDLPWFDKYHKHTKAGKMKKRVEVHLKVYPAIDLSSIFGADNIFGITGGKVADPNPEQISAMNTLIEESLTKIIEESRGVKAPARWDPRLNDKKGGRIGEANND